MQTLITRNDASLSVSFTAEALALQTGALEKSALIARVSCAEEQLEAVEAQKILASLIKAAENSRKAEKEPVLIYGRKIDESAKKFCEELLQEQTRIATLIGSFQALEMAKVRAAAAAENERLSALERERQRAIAEARSHDELDKVNAVFDTRAKDEAAAPVAPIRTEGQVVKEEWTIREIDLHELYRHHPHCVKLEARVSEIKAILNAGGTVRGVKADKEVKSSVRTTGALEKLR